MRRFPARVVLAAAIIWTLPSGALAHGIGGRQDLPVPLGFFVAGAGVVLVLSFVVLALLWPRPRLQDPPEGRMLADVAALSPVLGTGGLLALALVVLTGLAGIDNATRNPAPVVVFVVFWLVVPFISALVGNLYPLLDPWRRLVRWSGLGDSDAPEGVERMGYWPATVAFVAFTWLELVSPDTGPRALAVAALVYTAFLLGAAAWGGSRAVTEAFDAFSVYNRVLGAMAPLRLDQERHLRWRGWLRGLPGLSERPGIVAFVVAMIGTVTYDGMSATPWWQDSVGRGWDLVLVQGLGMPRAVAGPVAGTVGLVGVSALVGAGYLLACASAAKLGGATASTGRVATRFAHTLVPIAFAYAFAHYFTLVLFEGQLLVSTLSDPLGRGWDLFGTAGREVDFTLLSPTAVWYVQVTAIVLGHVAGVVLAHDRALADFPPVQAVRSQYAMLVLMVALTGLGLVILAAG